MTVRRRPAAPADRAAMRALVPRLRAFGDVPFRPADAHDRAEGGALEHALDAPDPAALLVVAEAEGVGGIAGVCYARAGTDYFTGERLGHLDILAVADAAEGRGVGRALIAAAEAWARASGFRLLDLNVFASNARARAVYERAGFVPDTVRYMKELRPA